MTPNEKLEYFNSLLSKYLDNKATPEEIDFIEKYYQQFDNDQADSLSREEIEQHQEQVLSNLRTEIFQSPKKSFSISRNRWIGWAAAIFIILLSGTTYLLLNRNPGKQVTSETSKNANESNIGPGTNKAFITLEDGSKILLDESTTGVIAQQGKTQVVQLASGEVVYKKDENADKPYTNTITTPRGGKYQLTLADGTKFWMNSESSITYPTFFPVLLDG